MNNPFNRIAKKYDDFFKTSFGSKVFSLERELLLKILSNFEGSTVLEVGAGTGIWLKEFASKFKMYGVDSSIEMLMVAKKKGLERLVCGDGACLPFGDDSFDLTLFITSLEFMAEMEKAFSEAVRVSRRGVVVAFLNGLSLLFAVRKVLASFKPSVYREMKFISKRTLKRLVSFAERETGKRLEFETFLTTLNFCIDGIVFPSFERRLGFFSPFGGFAVAKISVRRENGAG